jgi:hypothetical protein
MQHLICVNPVNLCLKNNETQPLSLLHLSCRPLSVHSYRVPILICSAHPCGVGGGRRFSINPRGLFKADYFIVGWI